MDKNDTATNINNILTWWKILDVKNLPIDKLHNDPLQAEIKSPIDSQLDFIIDFGQIAFNMASSQSNCIKQLSTKNCYYQTPYNGIASPSQQLLAISYKNVLLEAIYN